VLLISHKLPIFEHIATSPRLNKLMTSFLVTVCTFDIVYWQARAKLPKKRRRILPVEAVRPKGPSTFGGHKAGSVAWGSHKGATMGGGGEGGGGCPPQIRRQNATKAHWGTEHSLAPSTRAQLSTC